MILLLLSPSTFAISPPATRPIPLQSWAERSTHVVVGTPTCTTEMAPVEEEPDSPQQAVSQTCSFDESNSSFIKGAPEALKFKQTPVGVAFGPNTPSERGFIFSDTDEYIVWVRKDSEGSPVLVDRPGESYSIFVRSEGTRSDGSPISFPMDSSMSTFKLEGATELVHTEASRQLNDVLWGEEGGGWNERVSRYMEEGRKHSQDLVDQSVTWDEVINATKQGE